MNSAFIQPSAHATRVSNSSQLNLLAAQNQTLGANSNSQSVCPASPNIGSAANCAQLTPGLVTPPLQGAPNRLHAAYYHTYHHSNHLTNNIVARLGSASVCAQNYWQQSSCPYLTGQERIANQSEPNFLDGGWDDEDYGANYRLFETLLDQLEGSNQQNRNASAFWLTSMGEERPERMDTFYGDELEDLQQQLYQVPLPESEFGEMSATTLNTVNMVHQESPVRHRSASSQDTRRYSLDSFSTEEDESETDQEGDYFTQTFAAERSAEAHTLSPLSGSSAVHSAEIQKAVSERSFDDHSKGKHLYISDSDVAFYIALTSPNISKARYMDIIASMKRRGVIDTGNSDWERKLVQVRASRPVPKHLARAMSGENAILCADRAVLVASAREKDVEGKSVVTECERLSACMTVPTEWIVPIDASRRRKSISLDQLLPSLNRKVHQSNNVLLFVLLKKQTA